MSAYTLSNKHISGMLRAAIYIQYQGDSAAYRFNGENHNMRGEYQKIGQKLLDENYRSVNYRYSEEVATPEFKFTIVEVTPAQIIRACNCYNYQTCETPDWEQTEAHAIYDALRERAISALVDMHKETSDDTWDID